MKRTLGRGWIGLGAYATLILSLLLALPGASAAAQVIAAVPVDFSLDGSVNEWHGVPPTVVSGFKGNILNGPYQLWAGIGGQGLVIAGRIEVVPWTFSLHPQALDGGPLDIWLSIAEPFKLPDVEFTDSSCAQMAGAGDPAPCLQWVKDQGVYRDLLLRQFARFWRIAPDGAEESYALPSFDRLSEAQRKAIGFPRPVGLPKGLFRTAPDGSATFELLIPWEIFPPANRLSMERLQLTLGLEYTKAEPLPSYEAQQKTGWFAVTPPISVRITRCGQPLPTQNQTAFYFLNSSREVNTTFSLENHVWAYVPFPPPSDNLSPEVRYRNFFMQTLGAGEYLCGPYMSYRRGAVSRTFSSTIEAPPDSGSIMFPVKVLGDGTRLIRSGPSHWPQPEGWRRAYDIISMTIYALTPSLQAYEALRLGTVRDLPTGYEIEISDDWGRVTEYKQGIEGKWSSETFCRTGHLYRSCGKNPDSPPPKRRILTPD